MRHWATSTQSDFTNLKVTRYHRLLQKSSIFLASPSGKFIMQPTGDLMIVAFHWASRSRLAFFFGLDLRRPSPRSTGTAPSHDDVAGMTPAPIRVRAVRRQQVRRRSHRDI